jgi:hypothetical protein
MKQETKAQRVLILVIFIRPNLTVGEYSISGKTLGKNSEMSILRQVARLTGEVRGTIEMGWVEVHTTQAPKGAAQPWNLGRGHLHRASRQGLSESFTLAFRSNYSPREGGCAV